MTHFMKSMFFKMKPDEEMNSVIFCHRADASWENEQNIIETWRAAVCLYDPLNIDVELKTEFQVSCRLFVVQEVQLQITKGLQFDCSETMY